MRDFRSTTAVALSAITLSAGLLGCGEPEPEPETGTAAETVEVSPGQSDAQQAVDQARADAREATEAAGAGDPLADLSDETPSDAMQSYLAALAAGDFIRAADFTHPDAPGTARLIRTGEGFAEAMKDPQVQSMGLAGFLTQGLDQATFELVEEESEDRRTYEVSVPDKPSVLMDVVKLDDGWRVVPPDSGLPAS
jgi:hypothetical protein